MPVLILIAVLLVVGTPVLALLAIIRVQKMAENLDGFRPQDLIGRIYALEQKLNRLEKLVQARPVPAQPAITVEPSAPQAAPKISTVEPIPAALHAGPGGAKPSAPPHAASVPPPWPAPPLSTSASAPKATLSAPKFVTPGHASGADARDLESLIGGSWFNRLGILALIVAVCLFLKYAFDNNWIGPTGRIAIGLFLGAAMLPWSQWLLTRGYAYFSEGIAALGQATLLLSIWAGCRYYTLFSLDVGFAAMIVVTAVMAAVAIGRNSERIAVLSLVGGFLTPMLLSTGRDQEFALFVYLLILGAGFLVMASLREWPTLAPLSFVMTQLYFWGYYSEFYRPAKLSITLTFATLFFLLFMTLPALRAARKATLDTAELFVILLNSFAFMAALYTMLWPGYRWPLTLAVLLLSALHLGIARFVRSDKPGEWSPSQQLLAGLALTFVTIAIPIRLDGKWITLALAVEAALLIRMGYRSLAPLLRLAGFLLLAVAALRVLFIPLPAAQFLFNERFATFLGVIACMAFVLYSAQQQLSNSNSDAAIHDSADLTALAGLSVLINFYALVALSLELWDYFGRSATIGIDRGLAQHLALSVLWTAYASVLLIVGMKRHSQMLRWQALILFGTAVLKVFLYDSSFLERFYRILSFFILGIVLMVVSFLYQRKTTRDHAPS
ncbi:MAG TPA: DUF2339 domain-containing protein [Candidatus Acidoferrum sp.]|jgi:uncharacterized membrane protein